jgi:hypothetical protein
LLPGATIRNPQLFSHQTAKMNRRKQQDIEIPEGYVRGSDIDLSTWFSGKIAVDQNGDVRCVLGYRKDEQPVDVPYYSPLVAMNSADGRDSRRFVELRHGALTMSRFLDSGTLYRVLDDRYLVLPTGASSYFGVVAKGTRKEDEELTRLLFGGTYDEIEAVAAAVGSITGRLHQDVVRLPRLTFSKSRINSCDLTGCLIPMKFPYIAFEESQYDWGHVSLFGFFRLLSLLCYSTRNNSVVNALNDKGISAETVTRMMGGATLSSKPIPYSDLY